MNKRIRLPVHLVEGNVKFPSWRSTGIDNVKICGAIRNCIWVTFLPSLILFLKTVSYDELKCDMIENVINYDKIG